MDRSRAEHITARRTTRSERPGGPSGDWECTESGKVKRGRGAKSRVPEQLEIERFAPNVKDVETVSGCHDSGRRRFNQDGFAEGTTRRSRRTALRCPACMDVHHS